MTTVYPFPLFRELKNGARVIHQMNDVVLAEWDKGTRVEYVTWRIDNSGNAYCGHYKQTLAEALADFRKRI
jgi:hypothetical protein